MGNLGEPVKTVEFEPLPELTPEPVTSPAVSPEQVPA